MQILVLAGVATVALAAILLTIVPWRRVDAVARGFSWRRSIDINKQAWTHVTESRWPPPGNARNVQIRKKVVWGGRSVASQRNGFSSTTSQVVPVYSYEKPYWRLARTVTAAGEDRSDVSWPAYTLSTEEHERVGRRTASYEAMFQDANGKRYTKGLRESRWRSLEAGTIYALRLNALGSVLRVGPPIEPVHAAANATGEPGTEAARE